MFVSKSSFQTSFVLSASNGGQPLFTNTPTGSESTRVVITYLNEGAANVIWQIKPVGIFLLPASYPNSQAELLQIFKMCLKTTVHSWRANSFG